MVRAKQSVVFYTSYSAYLFYTHLLPTQADIRSFCFTTVLVAILSFSPTNYYNAAPLTRWLSGKENDTKTTNPRTSTSTWRSWVSANIYSNFVRHIGSISWACSRRARFVYRWGSVISLSTLRKPVERTNRASAEAHSTWTLAKSKLNRTDILEFEICK